MSAVLAADEAPKLEVGKPAPNFKVTPIGGDRKEPLTLADFKGQTLILEFWATWCGPCYAARLQLIRLHEDFAGQGVRILAITSESIEDVQKYLRKHPVPYLIGTDLSADVQSAYRVGGIPHAALIDKEGKLRYYGSMLTKRSLDKFLKEGIAPRVYAPTSQPSTPPANTILRLEISQPREKPRGAENFGRSSARDSVGFETPGARIETILAHILEVTRLRIIKDDSVPDVYWKVDFAYAPADGRKPDLQILVDSLCREAGVRIEEVEVERDIWVARHTGKVPPEGIGFVTDYDADAKTATYLGVPVSHIFRSHEVAAGAPIIDETRLDGDYRIELPYPALDFAATRKAFEKYGISFGKERRPIKLYKLTALRSTTQSSRE